MKIVAGDITLCREETDADRLGGLLADRALSLDLVSALAGDRLLIDAERLFLDELRATRGDRLYSDLIYAITHKHFSPETARGLWGNILRHKYEMSVALRRNIRIAVASMDYLSNITTDILSATVIGEAHIADIVRLSQRDGLTGLLNHACCFRKPDAELRRYERHGTPVSLMMINEIGYTRPHSSVRVWGHEWEGKIRIEAEDACGGLPAGKVEEIFRPFHAHGHRPAVPRRQEK